MNNFRTVSGFNDPIRIGKFTSLPVYVSEVGTKPLVILHELPGMTPSFIEYCREMSEEGFKVYMPLLFKSPETEMSALGCALFCVSREFRALFSARDGSNSRPVTTWLLELIDHISKENPDTKIGVVGMCLTGGFSIAAIAKPNVNAAILCQPSIPFFSDIETLGMSDQERANAKQGAKNKPFPCAKGYRYAKDNISRDSHIRAAADILGEAFVRHPDLAGKGHSTLTGNSPSPEVYQDVLSFLNGRL